LDTTWNFEEFPADWIAETVILLSVIFILKVAKYVYKGVAIMVTTVIPNLAMWIGLTIYSNNRQSYQFLYYRRQRHNQVISVP
jgi:hypothetical protein